MPTWNRLYYCYDENYNDVFFILVEAAQSHVMCSLFFTENNSEHELCFMYFVQECHDILSVYRIK